MNAAENVSQIRAAMPERGMFAGKEWLVSPQAFPITRNLADKLQALGTALLAFQKACNDLYHRSAAGEHAWVARLLDLGKPERMIALGRNARWRDDLPRVIRPDLILTETGVSIAELDSLPGGVGLTGWLGETYAALDEQVIGGTAGMIEGFSKSYPQHDILISRESGDYQPEMEWLTERLNTLEGGAREVINPWNVQPHELTGRDIYRFFEQWDVDNVEHGAALLTMAERGEINFTPPLKPFLEEKLWLALFWSPQLSEYWESSLSAEHLNLLRECIPFGWVLDPVKLPLHAEWPRLGVHDWSEMKLFGNKERELVIKVSGWSEKAWGSRGVSIGHDLSQEEWSAVIDDALESFPRNPHLMQRFAKAKVIAHPVWSEEKQATVMLQGRVRLCPYYFVADDAVKMGGMLATIVPADKKVLHGMKDAAMVPCSINHE
ncbi:MAG: hypothetical protein K8R87_02780 [Verrucomicrobia bacterium]|nr:hypothetical protein [Verrucomicrobiota bacterium]